MVGFFLTPIGGVCYGSIKVIPLFFFYTIQESKKCNKFGNWANASC